MENHPVLDLPPAPQWGNFLGQFGKFSVYVTLAACVLAVLLAIFQPNRFAALRRNSFYLACFGFVLIFAILAVLFVTNQFQFEYIFNHSALDNPLSYKIASVWTGQQGSFLLWAVYSAIFGWITLNRTQQYERWYTVTVAVFLAVLAGILAYETPFNFLNGIAPKGITLMPPNGGGMVPGLQNYWVVIHPPIIFLGFGSLTVPFAYGIAAMLTGNTTDWIKLCRAPVLFGVSVLGLGISLGGLWAYETQGWGGFWGWDPVENVSLVPWLLMVALAHGIIVQNVRKTWVSANLFMSGLPFVLFVYGTFLTRSGLLNEVSNHSFASMDSHALIALRVFLMAVVAGFLLLYFVKGRKLQGPVSDSEQAESGFNRASFYQMGAMSLCLLAFVISLGMSWPVITALRGGKGSAVDAGVYHKAVVWFYIAIMIAMAIGPFVSWRRDNLKNILGRFVTLASIAIGSVGVFLILAKNPNWGVGMEPSATVEGFWRGSTISLPVAVSVLLFFSTFVAVTNLWRAIELAKRSKLGIGPFIAHVGIAILLSGLIISKSLERVDDAVVTKDEIGTALGYKFALKNLDPEKLHDRDNTITFSVLDPQGGQFDINPNLYYHDGEQVQSWPFIIRSWSHDMYFFLSKPALDVLEQPCLIKPGETKVVVKKNSKIPTDSTITYVEMTRKGELGTAGVEFGAKLHIELYGNSYDVNPTIKMTDKDMVPAAMPRINKEMRVGLVPQMDAATKAVEVQIFWDPPLFPIHVFYKPLTCLVWIGTGIFTIGGFISAFYRRMLKKSPEGDFTANSAKIDSKN